MTSPDPVPAPVVPCAWTVTTEGSARVATSRAGQTSSAPLGCAIVAINAPSRPAATTASTPAAHQPARDRCPDGAAAGAVSSGSLCTSHLRAAAGAAAEPTRAPPLDNLVGRCGPPPAVDEN